MIILVIALGAWGKGETYEEALANLHQGRRKAERVQHARRLRLHRSRLHRGRVWRHPVRARHGEHEDYGDPARSGHEAHKTYETKEGVIHVTSDDDRDADPGCAGLA
jgi:hypothetical protein